MNYITSNNKFKDLKKLSKHDVDILDETRISVFNNNRLRNKFDKDKKYNDMMIYDFEKDEIKYVFKKEFDKFKIQTIGEGLADLYKDGSIFIEESNFGRILILDKTGEKVIEYINRSKTNNKIYRLNWSRVINLDLQKFQEELNKRNGCKK